MAYRSPAVCFLHAARAAGAAAITPSDEAAAFPKRRLIDNAIARPFKFNTSVANHTIVVDRGAAGLEAIDRMLIPAGHNLGGAAWEVHSSTTGAFAGEETLRGSGTFAAGTGLIDEALTSQTDQYVRLRITTIGQWEIGELFFTRTRTPTIGPVAAWSQSKFQKTITQETRGGDQYDLITAPARLQIAIAWPRMSGADLAIFTELVVAVQTHTPFYFVPPDDGDPITLVKLTRELVRQQDNPAPQNASGPSFTVDLELLEQLT